MLRIIKQMSIDKAIKVCWRKHRFLGYQGKKALKKLPEEGKESAHEKAVTVKGRNDLYFLFILYMLICYLTCTKFERFS